MGSVLCEVVRQGVEAVSSGVGLGLDFVIAVFTFSVSHWPLIRVEMACHSLMFVVGLETGRLFLGVSAAGSAFSCLCHWRVGVSPSCPSPDCPLASFSVLGYSGDR